MSQGSFGYSPVHKVYSEFRVWVFDNNKFPQDSIFDTTIDLIPVKEKYKNSGRL